MIQDFFLPISMVMGFAAYGLIARWYVMPRLRRLPRSDTLKALVFPHCFRFVGLAFLIPGVTSEVLDSRFANPAAYGDLLAALLAFLAILALHYRWAMAIPLVWIFNLEGTFDLFYAVFQGRRFIPDGHFGATYFIPAVVVPALLVTHFMIFSILIRPNPKR